MKFSKRLKHVTLGLAVTLGLLIVPSLSAQASSQYTVQSGDSLWAISQKYNTSLNSIVANNPGKLSSINSTIFPNETLTINGTSVTYTPSTNYQQTYKQPTTTYQAPKTNTTSQTSTSASSQASVNTNNSSAANQIAQAESGGSYTAQNGRYYGRYQLDSSYLHGDYSPANQERTFAKYCNDRYGSINNALAFRQSHGWY